MVRLSSPARLHSLLPMFCLNLSYIGILAAVRGPAGGGFNIEEQLRKLREAQRSSSVLEIGDLLRVRGSLKTSREQREIMASSFCKQPAETHLHQNA